jgi:type III secretion system FlhB-like substrate exporter
VKTAKAVALTYDRKQFAPQVSAKGHGRDAQKILQLAEDAGVEIVQDESLAALLEANTAVGDYIPIWCWEAVARVLAFVLAEEKK